MKETYEFILRNNKNLQADSEKILKDATEKMNKQNVVGEEYYEMAALVFTCKKQIKFALEMQQDAQRQLELLK